MDGHNILLTDCPARTTLEIVSGTWSVVVIYALRDKPLRFTELAAAIGGISNKVLTQTLRRLEAHSIIARERDVDGTVRYAMTELGLTLRGPVAALAEWAHTNAEAVADARDSLARA